MVTTGSVLQRVSIFEGEVTEGGWEFNESGRQKANKPTAGHYTMGDTENIQMACK